MAEDERWLTCDEALSRLKRFLNLSVGAAEAALRQAISGGAVRSRAVIVLVNDHGIDAVIERLQPSAWTDNHHPIASAEISSDDLELWVAQQLTRRSTIDEPADPPIAGSADSAKIARSGVQTNKQAALKAQCSEWISALPSQPPRRKSELKTEAIAHITGLSGRQFDAAWDEAAPAAWKVPGPK